MFEEKNETYPHFSAGYKHFVICFSEGSLIESKQSTACPKSMLLLDKKYSISTALRYLSLYVI